METLEQLTCIKKRTLNRTQLHIYFQIAVVCLVGQHRLAVRYAPSSMHFTWFRRFYLISRKKVMKKN